MNGQSSIGPALVNILVGVWLVCSPFVLGFTRNATATWNNIAVGIALILITLAGEWWDMALGPLVVPLSMWLFLSPFILGISTTPFLANNVSIAFVAIAAGAISDGLRSPDVPDNVGPTPEQHEGRSTR